jgi:glycine cleavage system H protein
MTEFQNELRYLKSHEWASREGDIVVVGISDHAQDALGDVVYVELPEIGSECIAGEEIAVVESVKAASDIYAPVGGVVIEINLKLDESPELVNEAPYTQGWFLKIKASDVTELESMLTAHQYMELCGAGEE